MFKLSTLEFMLNVQVGGGADALNEDTPWLSQDQRAAWMALTAMFFTLPPAIDDQLKRDAGINFFEYTILAGLSQAPGRTARMSLLAHLTAGSLSRLSHAITRLEKQGWVRRRPGSDHPRATDVVLTGAGMAKLVASAPDHVREARRLVVDALTPTDLAQLQRICRQLVATANPEAARLLDEAREQLRQITNP